MNGSEADAREYLESIGVVVLTSNDAGPCTTGRLETEVTENIRNRVGAVRNELRHCGRCCVGLA